MCKFSRFLLNEFFMIYICIFCAIWISCCSRLLSLFLVFVLNGLSIESESDIFSLSFSVFLCGGKTTFLYWDGTTIVWDASSADEFCVSTHRNFTLSFCNSFHLSYPFMIFPQLGWRNSSQKPLSLTKLMHVSMQEKNSMKIMKQKNESEIKGIGNTQNIVFTILK